MKKTTLVILAAGIGSRYGGIKQLDTITPQGYTIIDFSLYDAINAGFSKIIFIVRKSIHKDFKAVFDKKLKRKNVEVQYVDQEVDFIPKEFLPTKRKKPWGTGHAVLMAEDFIEENFCVINADDFYGKSSFEKIYEHLQKAVSLENDFSMVGYRLKNTLSKNGSVSRGQCFVDNENFLEQIFERTKIYQKNEKIVYLDEEKLEISISPNTITSMNLWGFTPNIFEGLRNKFNQFLILNSLDEQTEYLLPNIVNDLIKENKASVKVLKSEAKWMGVTYREDKKRVTEKIIELQEKGIYPKNLW